MIKISKNLWRGINDRKSTPIKFLYSVGRVTGPAQAGQPAFILEGFQGTGSGLGGTPFSNVGAPNAMQLRILTAARALKELEENLIVNGDASTTDTEFSGIVKLQGTTNQLDKDSGALTWRDIEAKKEVTKNISNQIPNL